jgi:hypothetical protein
VLTYDATVADEENLSGLDPNHGQKTFAPLDFVTLQSK